MEVLIAILAGYSVVSVFFIVRTMISISNVQLELRVNKVTCQKDLERLEERISRHINNDTRKLDEDIARLEKVQKSLSDIVDSTIKSSKLLKG